jgi:hypothetical protein
MLQGLAARSYVIAIILPQDSLLELWGKLIYPPGFPEDQ